MNNRRSYLDTMNAGRRRRATTSLHELSRTLDELEGRVRRPFADEGRAARGGRRELPADGRISRHAPDYERPSDATHRQAPAPLASELGALRDELREQMGAGLQRQFSGLKADIERALQTSAPLGQVADLGAEFERLSSMINKLAAKGDDRQIDLLRHEMAEVKNSLGKLAREDTVQSVDRRWQDLDQRWRDIASQLHDDRGNEDGNAAIDALAARLDQIGESVAALPTSMALHSLDEKVRVLSGAMDQLARHQNTVSPGALDAIDERLNEISRAVAAASTIARPAQLDTEPFERIEARISLLARQLGEVVEESQGRQLAEQLDTLAGRVEELGRRVDLPERAVERLSNQVDLIATKLDQSPAIPDLNPVFDSLESRFASLSAMLEQRQDDALSQGQSLFRDLERQLGEVATRIDRHGADAAPDTQLIAAMDARFDELASRLERTAPEPLDDRAMRDLEQRVEAISQRIDDTARAPGLDPELIRSLESQIAGLAVQISTPVAASGETADLGARLDFIERSIVEGRQDIIQAARQAAEEAVRSFSGSAGDGVMVAGLAEDLKTLESLTRKSDDRNAKTFEAIHDTLLKIVDRLGSVEATERNPVRNEGGVHVGPIDAPSLEPSVDAMPMIDMSATDTVTRENTPRSAAAAAAEAAADAMRADKATETDSTSGGRRSMLGGLTKAFSSRKARQQADDDQTQPAVLAQPADAALDPVEDVPDIDPAIANRPLEPGSGAPDLNAIMKRVRDERGQPAKGSGADTAKADFIAAARRAAQAAAAEAEVMKRRPSKQDKKTGFKIGELLGRKRKPVLMGVAAVLMALAALQVGRSFLAAPTEVADAPAPAPIVSEVVDPEDAAPVAEVAEVEAPAPVVRMVEDARPIEVAPTLAEAPASADAASTDWLENDEVVSSVTPQEPEIVEDAAEDQVTQPAADALAAIPVEAGPVALREAASAGDPKAMFEIGNRYAEGRGVTEDMAKAAEWYARAAEQGLAPAEYRIGNLHEKGVGVTRDVAKAKTWYQLAAAQGNASAMHNLAVLFAMGADGTTDNESAARWFSQAAEVGVIDSQFNLAILAAKGVGIPQDLEAAYKWFALVAKAGDRDAAAKRDEVAKALRPEQLDRARAAAELWRAKPLDPEANDVVVPDSWSEDADTTASVDMGQAVRNIQRILNKNGYDAGAEDGLMGQRTRDAIAKFQADSGLEPTGEVDEPLVRALLERR